MKVPMKEVVDELVSIVGKYDKLDVIGDKVRSLHEAFENFKLPVVLVGEFSAGKSSLINAFLGENLLPVDTSPTTDRPYEIMYSKEPFRREEGRKVVIGLDNPNLKPYSNLKIVDLPGITSQYHDHYSITMEYLTEEKGILFVVVLDVVKGTISDDVMSFIEELKEFHKDYAVLFNKIDKVSEDSLQEIIEETLSQLRETYKEPYFYGKVSPSEGQVMDFARLLGRLSAEYEKRREEVFRDIVEKVIQDTLNSLEYLKEELHIEKETTLEELSRLQRKLEDLEKKVQSEREREINKLSKRLMHQFKKFTSKIHNEIMGNIDVYVDDPDRLEDDLKELLSNMDKELEEALSKEMEGFFETLQKRLEKINIEVESSIDLSRRFGEILKGTHLALTAKDKKGKGTDLVVSGAGFLAGVQVLERTLLGMGKWGMRALKFLKHPAVIVISFLGPKAFEMFMEARRRKKVIESVERALNGLISELEQEAETIIEDVASGIYDAYEEKLRTLREEIEQQMDYINMSAREKETFIRTLNRDIDRLKTFVSAISS